MRAAWVWISWIIMGILHFDFWNWSKTEPFILGMPIGLAYHVFYSVISIFLISFIIKLLFNVESFKSTGQVHSSKFGEKGELIK